MGKKYKHLKVTKEELEDLYWNQRLSQALIAKKFGCTQSTISRQLRKYGIRTRTIREANLNSTIIGTRKGYYIRPDGYKIIYRNGKAIREHRYVMEQVLGRKLKETEIVHHLNGIRNDNRPENLVVIDRAKTKHETWTLYKLMQERIRKLEEENRRLRSEIEKLKERR